MGWGDVKYLAAIGAVVGLRGVVGILVVASILGALVGLALIASGRGSGKTALPFGTFLAIGGDPVALRAGLVVGLESAVGSHQRLLEAAVLIGKHGPQIEHNLVILDACHHRR